MGLGTAHHGGETLILGAVEAEKGILLLQVITKHLEMRVTQGNRSASCQGVTGTLLPHVPFTLCLSLSHQRGQPRENFTAPEQKGAGPLSPAELRFPSVPITPSVLQGADTGHAWHLCQEVTALRWG